MKVFLKEITFESKKDTYVKNFTEEVRKSIKKSKVKNGLVMVSSKHTTFGIIVNEISEPNLINDVLGHTLISVHEDRRSERAVKDYKHPTKDYTHRCQDNPFCNEIDEDYNAAAHIRSLSFSHPSIILPIKNSEVELGKYQEIAGFEFDGRDGSGKNPVRNRTIQIWIYDLESEFKVL
jgi:thiamine phosphate synthase YjbQ (UPF0047 family)